MRLAGSSGCNRYSAAIKAVEMPGDVSATADPEQLRQVLVNLGLNALDALPNGGSLRVAVRAEPDRVALAVCDTGLGIAPEEVVLG